MSEAIETNGEADVVTSAMPVQNGHQDGAEASPTPAQLRLRVKVWTDPATKKRYLVAGGRPDPASGTMVVDVMRDDDTKVVRLTPAEWNALDFFFFEEDGPAPRPTSRPPDGVQVSSKR